MQDPKIKILVVDDEEFWRTHLAKLLRRNNFEVDAADSLEAAKELLSSQRYHLVITDIMLVDDDVPTGIELLKYLEDEISRNIIQVIAISGRSDKKIVRETFHQRVSEFLFKGDYDEASQLEADLVKAVKEALIDIQSTVELVLDDSTLELLLAEIRIGNQPAKRRPELLKGLKEEMLELLRKLYPRATQLKILTFSNNGNSGTGVSLVQSTFEQGAVTVALMKYGEREKIHAEQVNYTEYASFISSQYRPELERYAETHTLSGIMYSYITKGESKAQEFLQFFREQSIGAIQVFLGQFFRQVCAAWYTNPAQWVEMDIAALYRDYDKLTKEILIKALKDKLPDYYNQMHLDDAHSTQPLYNPVYIDFEQPIVRLASFRITHGDLNLRNILVGEGSKPWLIDFLSVGYGHSLRDFIALEISLKFEALEHDQATLEERLDLEAKAVSTETFGEWRTLEFETTNTHLKKCFETIKLIRRHAEAVEFPDKHLFQYHVGLFFSTLSILRYYQLSKVQRTHALFSAAMLAQKIGLAPRG